MAKYVGWIPTANGRLSFRHIGETKNADFSLHTNVLDGSDRRRIFAYQKRNLSDLLFRSITEVLTHRRGRFTFVLSCQTSSNIVNDLDALLGSIYIFKSRASFRNAFPGRLRDIIDRCNDLGVEPAATIETSKLLDEGQRLAAAAADITVEFEMYRDGQVAFEEPVFRDESLQTKSASYAVKRGVPFTRWIADQAYFFLRDLTHTHQHHSPKVDTILLLQEHDSKDVAWRNHVIYSLHHYIIRMKRSRRPNDLHRGIGVLAYAKAFEGVCYVRSSIVREKMAVFQSAAIQESLVSRIEEINFLSESKSKRQDRALSVSMGYRTLFFTSYLTLLVVVVTIMLPFIEAHKEQIEKLGETLVEAAPALIFGTAVLFFVTWVLTSPRYFKDSFYQRNFLFRKDFLALSLLHRKFVAVLSSLASLILAGFAAFLSWHNFF